MEVPSTLDDDIGPSRRSPFIALILVVLSVSAFSIGVGGPESAGQALEEMDSAPAAAGDSSLHAGPTPWATARAYMPVPLFLCILVLLVLSAFFSASEVAFFSIHRLRLRGMGEEGSPTGRLVSRMMEHPGRLLTNILVGNMIVNVLISVLLPARVERIMVHALAVPSPLSYVLAVALCTAVLVLFGEVSPKVFAVRVSEIYARSAAIPLSVTDWVLGPLRWSLLHFTDFIFHVTRFNDIQAAPFITDEEFKSVLSNGEAQGVIEKEEEQMIQRILEFGDALLREILVPRPDVAALDENATVGQALEFFREHEFSRMPVYRDDLDHVTGVLFAKDMLPSVVKGDLTRPIRELARPPRFVPETMTVRGFVKDAQRMRRHLAIVVDEYGGTEGIVTLEDALEEVVGDIHDEDKEEKPLFEELGDGVFRVDGGLPLDELSDLIGMPIEDEEHETVAGFLMEQTQKIPELGDRIEHLGALFIVEKVDGKRAAALRIEVPAKAPKRGGE